MGLTYELSDHQPAPLVFDWPDCDTRLSIGLISELSPACLLTRFLFVLGIAVKTLGR